MASPGVYPNIFTAPELQYTISPTLLAHTIASCDIFITERKALSANTPWLALELKLVVRGRPRCAGGSWVKGVGGNMVASIWATLTFFLGGLGEVSSNTLSSVVTAEGLGETPRLRIGETPRFRIGEMPRFRMGEIPLLRVGDTPLLEIGQIS